MKTLIQYLEETDAADDLKKIILALAGAFSDISDSVRRSDGKKVSTENDFGEQQLELDVVADNILLGAMKETGVVGFVASEEVAMGSQLEGGKYAVVHDPLDGSSLVDVNLSVGTIVGVYETLELLGAKGDDQVASVVAVYGPRTSMFLTVGDGTHYFVLGEGGEFVLQKEGLSVGGGKMFAPGNLRACSERQDYLDLVNYWIKEQYTLRYSGGMVPDVGQIMLKGKGIFSYPGYGDAPDGKLRLVFECAPMAFLMEQAGGSASDGKMRILDKKIDSFDQRTPVFIGSSEEVKRCEDMLS